MLRWYFQAVFVLVVWESLSFPNHVAATQIICDNTRRRSLTNSFWADLETFCSNVQYELALTFHQEHTLLKATPLEQNPFCTTVYFHKDNGIKQSFFLQTIQDNTDAQHPLDNTEQNFLEDNETESSLLLGIFEFQEIVAAYESTPTTDQSTTTNGYDLVLNNCAKREC